MASSPSAGLEQAIPADDRIVSFLANLSLTNVASEATISAMDEKTICQNIKTLRLTRKMTLDDLSCLTGLSKGYLSKVERSGKLPPFSTLNRIASALRVETVSLFNGQPEPLADTRISIVRKYERKIIATKGSLYGYKYETLAHNKPGKSMEPYVIEPAFD